MDIVDLTKEIDKLNRETIPLIHEEIAQLVRDLHALLDRLNQATITATISIPPRSS